MIRYFFTIAKRSLTKQGMFPLINIVGLTAGLTVVLIICAMVFNEYSFDKSFRDGSRIYRVNSYFTKARAGETLGISSDAVAPAVREEIPEAEVAVRTSAETSVIKVGEIPFKIDKICWADEGFFRLFDRPFVYGSPETALSRPGTVAVSESTAETLFGDKNPLGETVLINNTQRMEVSAVYKDFPSNSSLRDYRMIGYHKFSVQEKLDWNNVNYETFCLLTPGADASAVEARMQELLEKNVGSDWFYQIRLQPFERIHLYSKDNPYTYLHTPGDIGKVRMFSLLALIILLVACINYMNLSTARAQKRSKEIGISKTLGAKRSNIVWRLYAETGILTLIAFVSAFFLACLLLPVFNNLSGQDIHVGLLFTPVFLVGALSVYLFTTLIAASYPALYLSGFAPLTVIRRSAFTKGSGHALVRKGLTVVQFSVAIILIVWVMVIRTQVNYVFNKDLGYHVNNVMGISLTGLQRNFDFDALKNDLMAQSSVSEAAFSWGFPFYVGGGSILYKSLADMNQLNAADATSENTAMCMMNAATSDIIDLFQMKLIAGTAFPESKKGDSVTYVVLNRKAVEFMGISPEEAVGKRMPMKLGKALYYISGVVENFNYLNLHDPIGPYGFYSAKSTDANYLLLKVKDGSMSQQLADYEKIFKKHFPNDFFEAHFPNLFIEKAYESDRQTNRMVLCFSVLAVLVACMGVFGLTAFMAEQRTKEIGIRKVLGANVGNIVSLFTNNYVQLLAISLVIALPIAWWVGNSYLRGFAYRISLGWWIFAAAALITVALTLFTVCLQAVKAATADPVKSIKVE